MVHCLETIRKLESERAARKPHKKPKAREVPPEIGLSPVAARRFLNRPWTSEELCGRPDPYRTYAEDNARRFRGREGRLEPERF